MLSLLFWQIPFLLLTSSVQRTEICQSISKLHRDLLIIFFRCYFSFYKKYFTSGFFQNNVFDAFLPLFSCLKTSIFRFSHNPDALIFKCYSFLASNYRFFFIPMPTTSIFLFCMHRVLHFHSIPMHLFVLWSRSIPHSKRARSIQIYPKIFFLKINSLFYIILRYLCL